MLKIIKILLFFSLSLALLLSFSYAKAQETTTSPEPAKIRVIYFYAYDCPNCAKIKPFIEKIKEKYKDKIDFLEHDVKDKEECRQLFFKFTETYNLPSEKAKVPLFFIGNDYLLGATDIENNLEEKIQEKIANNENLKIDCHKFLEDWEKGIHPSGVPDLSVCSADNSQDFCSIDNPANKEKPDNAKQTISVGLIITTAAIDSVNPCAIAVLLFLIAVLISLKANRKRILTVGLVYIFGVFISYYLAGVGLLGAISHFNISRQINIFAGAIIIIASFISIKEGLMPQGLQLLVIPKKTKGIFMNLMQKGSYPAVFLAGILVSAFELPCTGQVYLGILSLMSQENMKAQAYSYLLLYNLIFVLPLIIILAAAAWGLDIEKIQKLRKETRMGIKILIGAIMLVLGIWLIYSTLY